MIVNLQRKVKIKAADYKPFALDLLAMVEEAAYRSFAVAFVSDSRMRDLNKFFRDKDSTTDVLSFRNEPDEFEPATELLGDVVISLEQAQKQAAENGLTLELEIKQLMLHGLLHLCGYDHEVDNGEMNARELELRRELKIQG